MQRHARRVGIFLAGWAVVIVGLVLVPLPGPGWVVVFVGLSLLATEFAWAALLKTRVQQWLTRWVAFATARSWRRRGEQAAAPLVSDPAETADEIADHTAAQRADERSIAS